MAHNQRNYDTEYKVQAVKLSQEIGAAKAASELGVCVDTLYGWRKTANAGFPPMARRQRYYENMEHVA